MISGMYLGEIARLVLVELMELGLLLKDQTSSTLREKGSFSTKFISDIETE